MNDDAVLLVVADTSARLTERQLELKARFEAAQRVLQGASVARARGYTAVQVGNHNCVCDGGIKPQPDNPLIARFQIAGQCPGCIDILVNHLACIFAGGAATSILKPGASTVDIANSAIRTLSETRHDCQEIDRILRGLNFGECQRTELERKARELAESRIRGQSKAVSVIAESLCRTGVLDGPDAVSLVRETYRNNDR